MYIHLENSACKPPFPDFQLDLSFGGMHSVIVCVSGFHHIITTSVWFVQVRTTGPIDILTHQPVKGRKRAGGIRFGEMESDSLLAHGSSFLLQDRLLNCSDRSYVSV